VLLIGFAGSRGVVPYYPKKRLPNAARRQKARASPLTRRGKRRVKFMIRQVFDFYIAIKNVIYLIFKIKK
jgi:hypothetical protein